MRYRYQPDWHESQICSQDASNTQRQDGGKIQDNIVGLTAYGVLED